MSAIAHGCGNGKDVACAELVVCGTRRPEDEWRQPRASMRSGPRNVISLSTSQYDDDDRVAEFDPGATVEQG